ncbi:MAG: hypothetical protein AAFO03_09470 [Bacteroidota bacterium]
MRPTLLLLSLFSISLLSAQRTYECDQLAIAFHGIVATDNGDHLQEVTEFSQSQQLDGLA